MPNVSATLPNPAPAPATAPHELELLRKRELLQKARIVRERLATRHSDLQGCKPNKVYIWVNTHESRQVYFQALGYVLCTDPDIKSPFRQADNTHRRADSILYEIDRDFYEALQADQTIAGIERLEGAKDGFEEELLKSRVPVYHPKVSK